MENTKLCPPAIQHARRIAVFFQEDPDVGVFYKDGDGEEMKTISLMVNGETKARALGTLLNGEKVFGNETIKIEVQSTNKKQNFADLFRAAFSGNDAVTEICKDNGPLGGVRVIFKPKVVQYMNDDISDLNGLHSTLYQYLADKIFDRRDGVFFNTAPIIDDDDDDDEDGGYDE